MYSYIFDLSSHQHPVRFSFRRCTYFNYTYAIQ